MAEINDLAILAANNTGRFPEGVKAYDLNDNLRELEAMLARFSKDLGGAINSSGTGTAYIISPFRTIIAHAAGLAFVWKANVSNTGAATLQVGSLSAKPLRRHGGAALVAGDISANEIIHCVYNASGDYYECIGILDNTRTVQPWASLTCINGANTDLLLPEGTNFRITGPTGAYTISGLTQGVDGRFIRLYNSVAQSLTITNDATSTAGNRFLTLTGADITTTTQGVFSFVYDGVASRWIQVGNQL